MAIDPQDIALQYETYFQPRNGPDVEQREEELQEQPTVPEDDGDVTTPPEEVPSSPPAEEPVVTTPDGRSIPLAQFNQLYEFDQFIRSNPAAWQSIQRSLASPPVFEPPGGVAAGGAGPSTVPSTAPSAAIPTIPEQYADDPGYKALWDRSSALEQRLASLDEYARQERERNARAALTTASSRFQQRMGLTDAQMNSLSWALSQNGQAPASLQTPQGQLNPIEALERAYEYTFYTTPEFRQLEIQKATQTHTETSAKDSTRKKKLSAVAGSGAVTPPQQPPAPRNRQERLDAIAAEIARVRAGS